MVFAIILLSLLSSGASPIAVEDVVASTPNPAVGELEEPEIQLRVRVLRGTAEYVLPEGGKVKRLRPSKDALRADSGIYLEFGISTKVELVWAGVGSTRIEGPAAISWKTGLIDLHPDESARIDLSGSQETALNQEQPETAGSILARFEAHKKFRITNRPPIRQPVSLVLGAFKNVELEAHGPGFQLLFDREGWSLAVPSGAVRLVSRKDEQLEVNHHGGLPIRVRTNQLRPPGTWPVRIQSGSRLLLPAPLRE